MSPWKVVATQKGFYNQTFREVGEVFELLCYEDGSYPVAVRELLKRDEKGQPVLDPETGEQVIIEQPIVDAKTKKPVHRDYAEDQGARLLKRGPKRGESVHLGWMRRVPDRVPCGMYLQPGETNATLIPDFWSPGLQLPQPFSYAPGAPPDPRRIHAPVLSVLSRPLPDEAA